MREVMLNFDEFKLIPSGVVGIEINGVKMNFVNEAEKKVSKTNSQIVVSNALATSLQPSSDLEKVPVHIVTKYHNLDTGEKVVVHERTNGVVDSIECVLSNGDKFSSYDITIKYLDKIDYTMEIKTDDDLVNDKIEALQKRVNLIDDLYDDMIECRDKQHKKDKDELLAKIEEQSKAFEEFKAKFYKAFGTFIDTNL